MLASRSIFFAFLLGYVVVEGLESVCRDYVEIPKDVVSLPERFQKFGKPWLKDKFPKAKIYESQNMKQNWAWISKLPVQGLNTSVGEVARFLRAEDCLFIVWGGSVRDAVRGQIPTDIDSAVTCNPHFLKRVCIEKFGHENCKRPHTGSSKLVMGNWNAPGRSEGLLVAEPLDLAHWNTSFEVYGSKWELSPNTLAYYVDIDAYGNDRSVIIDLYGKAMNDACDQTIAIPTEKKYWDKWSRENNVNKLLRYWKLRAKGFKAFDDEVHNFIVRRTKEDFDPKAGQYFYCHSILEGVYTNTSCWVKPHNLNHKRTEKIQRFRSVIKEDLGQDFWDYHMKPAFDSLDLIVHRHTR